MEPQEPIPNEQIKLYQYTSAAGLKGVLENKIIWLSHINYQNDTDEYYHALRIIKRILKKEYPGLNLVGDDFEDTIYPIYTASFTTAKDLLSQWRGYCPNGGYSYAIKSEQLHESVSRLNNQIALNKCIYGDDDAKYEFVKTTILGMSPQEYATRNEGGFNGSPSKLLADNNPLRFKYLRRLGTYIQNYASLMKSKHFKEEQEWRIHTFDDPQWHTQTVSSDNPRFPRDLPTKFRESKNVFIPYLELDLRKGSMASGINYDKVHLDEVIVSPTPNKMLAKASCEMLVKQYSEFRQGMVRNSEIPYKNW